MRPISNIIHLRETAELLHLDYACTTPPESSFHTRPPPFKKNDPSHDNHSILVIPDYHGGNRTQAVVYRNVNKVSTRDFHPDVTETAMAAATGIQGHWHHQCIGCEFITIGDQEYLDHVGDSHQFKLYHTLCNICKQKFLQPQHHFSVGNAKSTRYEPKWVFTKKYVICNQIRRQPSYTFYYGLPHTYNGKSKLITFPKMCKNCSSLLCTFFVNQNPYKLDKRLMIDYFVRVLSIPLDVVNLIFTFLPIIWVETSIRPPS